MSKRNVRIAIRDTTDSHNVGFFDNKSGIKYNSANLTQFLKGACSVLVLTYRSKKMVAQSGQKLAFRFKDKDFWLNINSVKKTGYKIELTAYSLSLEANKEKRGPHKPANAMSIKQYIDYYDPEHSFEIGINEVADKSIKLEWSGTDTILARLYSVANSFGAELEFVTELNNDYSLKRHVVNIYREGNLGKDKTGMPVRVGEKLKVINYSDNMDDFYTAIRRTGKDGLTMAGLNKKIYDDKGNVLFYNNSNTIYAPQARDKYPSIARKTNDGYIINEDSETEHTSKEALFGYMLSELKKHCELKVDYEVEGAVDGSIGDRKTLIDARHFDPPLYVQARISEQTEALLETSDVKTTLSNYVRKSSQIANELLQRVEQLTLEATPYTIKLATNNGIVFKNNQGQSTIYPTLKRGQKPVECTWKWLVDNQGFGTSPTFEVQAAGMSSKLVLTAIALIDGKEVAREQVTFTNVNDGAKGSDGKSITVAKAEKQSDGVKVTFSDNKSIVVPKGDKGDKGDPADPVPLNALQEEMKQTKQGLSDVKTDLLKEKAESSANIERVKKEVGAISSQQTAYEQSNTENLARITGQLGDKASKSEIKQTADGIREEMSQLSKNADEKISAAKTTFEKTAEGLKTDMVAVKSYVANDGKRREELEQYSREETAKQIASERSAVAQNYVGKSQYTEDVKGVNRRFEELRTGTSNLLLNTEFKTLADVNNVNGATLKLNQNDYNSHNSIEVTVTGQNKNVWKGITLNASVSAFKKGDTIAVRMPIYIFSDVPINAGLTLVLKNRSKNIAYVLKGLGGLPRNKWHIVELLHTFNSDANFEGVNFFHLYATQNGHYKIAEPSLTLSNVIPSSWAPAVEDSKNYTDTKLAEYKQGVDGQFAAVKQEVGSKVSQATFDQRANQITQSVQELNNNTVKKNQIKIDENGLVSSSEKIVNGQTLASMISQNPEWVEIIAKLLKIKADMIVNGAVTADKLNVEKLSALTSDLGKVTAGLIDLRKHWVRTSTDDVWGIINDVTYDTSTLLSDDGILTNGRPGRNKKSDVKPTIMPLVWLNSGQLFFANVDSEYDIIQMLLNGVYPFVRGNTAQIRFGKLEDEREALFIDCQFAELYLKANNYTDWKQSTFNSGVRWKVQGNLILVDYDVTFNKDGNQAICGVPQEYVAGARMFVVKAWSLNKDKDRTAQLNADGSLHILGAEKGMNYRGQIIWAY
ncbi:phage tail protein [Streptococcus anginosus]|uniref:phage tail protein n=1 Tax=Streptococcus anginosus TaxID=1328 RepID=UPI0012456449|nr:phage tail protein [Streptococcus anginosus]KAA9305126.1 hypothetical protein F6I02_03750 [Streptococcus anginosus]